ncbi:pseudouridine synthase [Sphingomonas alpina]|uniref:Pseudouridine synthase n=2 Tax=Sphingomonas alpina TaxID=653931 RepID=A0A7H0LQK8_9SPHN|nr:pseudouridine synthase [Sphingomonas alpina]
MSRNVTLNKPSKDAPGESSRDSQRIAKLLARAGIASRREVERMITEGRVALNGVAIETPATILTSLAGVTVDGNPVQAAAPARLFLYHKPSGLLVTERDPGGRPTIYDKLPKDLPRLVPVGRLDLNTEGLLLLTTDGELKRQLELPATGVERAYRARAYGAVTQAQLEDLIHGVEIEGVRYGSINANLERRTGANVWIEMILTEGKNREVRRVLEYLGLKVSRLIRTRYGPFVLGDLPPGDIGEVRQHDVVAFRKNPTRNPPPERLKQDEKYSARPRPTPVVAGARRPPSPAPRRTEGPGDRRTPSAGPRAARPEPVTIGDKRPARPKAPAPRIDRAAASRADRESFTDARPPRAPRGQKPAGWAPDTTPGPGERPPRDARPTSGAAPKPKRFYDAKPKQGVGGEGGDRPKRVFNAELGRNVRAKPDARAPHGDRPARPPRADRGADARPSSRPTKPRSGSKPGGPARPPKTRK